MNQGRATLERLEEVRLQGVLQDHRHRPGDSEVLGRDRLPRPGAAHHDPAEPLTHVPQGGAERQDHHDLTGRGDVEAALTRHAVHPSAEADDDVAQRPVVDVDHASPRHAPGVETHGAPVVQIVVDHRRQQVVRRGDGVEVAGEVEVDPLHRNDLAVAASGRSALDAEGRPHRRLTQGHDGLGTAGDEPFGEADARGGLALTERRGRHRGDHDVLRATARRGRR